MKTNALLTVLVMAFSITLGLNSCGPGQSGDAESAASDTTAAVAPDVSTTSPKHIMYVVHDVADFAAWKTSFDAHESMRQKYGLSLISVMRDLDHANKVHVAVAASDLAKAKEFAGSEDLKNAMQKAGVVGAPSIYFLNAEFADLASSDNPNRVIVMHKVKDYAAWKPVFDEHKAKRVEYGLTDRLVARVDGDPNTVALSFLPADLNRAREFAGLPDLKATMEKGGVEGPPTFSFTAVVK